MYIGILKLQQKKNEEEQKKRKKEEMLNSLVKKIKCILHNLFGSWNIYYFKMLIIHLFLIHFLLRLLLGEEVIKK